MTQRVFHIVVEIRFAWWLHWLYLPGVRLMVILGAEPDPIKITAAFNRALLTKIVHVPAGQRLSGQVRA